MRILVKIGSALISEENQINYNFISRKVKEMSALKARGHEIILVSSGAVAAGMELRGITERPKDTLHLQMLSGMGQVNLIKYYKDFFRENNQFIAQVLVTHHNFDKENEVRTLMTVLDAYLSEGTIPIINENDIVDKTELEGAHCFSDNDILAAVVSVNLKVNLTVILTDVDGLFADNPKENPDARFFDEVDRITEEIYHMSEHGKSYLGLGGMKSKVKAAEITTSKGIPVIVANGNKSLVDIIDGKARRTYFKP